MGGGLHARSTPQGSWACTSRGEAVVGRQTPSKPLPVEALGPSTRQHWNETLKSMGLEEGGHPAWQ